MAKEKANRKRSVQIKFRLTPEESAVLESAITEQHSYKLAVLHDSAEIS